MNKRAKRPYKDWIKEKTFANVKEAERAIIDEDCWSYRFKNHTYEGIKKYYECKYGKRRKKKCAQEIHLMFENDSQIVHLFRTNRNHTHSSSAAKRPVMANIVPPLNAITCTSTIAPLSTAVDFVKQEPLDKVENDHETYSNTDGMDESNNIGIEPVPKKLRTQRMWLKEATFKKQEEALDFLRKEGCWGYRFTNTTTDGIKNYFRCNLTRTRGKQCAQEIYLFFETMTGFVHLYRTDQGHTHDDIMQEYMCEKRDNEPPESNVMKPYISNTNHNQNLKLISVTGGAQISEDNYVNRPPLPFVPMLQRFSMPPRPNLYRPYPQYRMNLPPMPKLKPKPRAVKGLKNWVKEITFPNAERAERALKMEACWSYRFQNTTSEGVKKYYRCNLTRRHGEQCAQEVHLVYEANSPRVHFYRTDNEHTHIAIGVQDAGMHPLVKEEISLLYRNFVRKAGDVLQFLSKNPNHKLPSLRQVSNYIQYLKRKQDSQPATTSLNSNTEIVIKTEPQDEVEQTFSSGDLSSECEDGEPKEDTGAPRPAPLQQQPLPTGGPPNIPPPPAPGTTGGPPMSAGASGPELSLSFGKGPPRGTSAPSSPAKSRESLLQRVQSLTGAARDQGASIIGAAVSSATRPAFNKDRCLTLLVLDDQNTDWSKYFRGKRLHGDYDIRVEQAEFREISLIASADGGTVVSMAVIRGGTKVARSFKPDFVLVRQPPRDGSRDSRSALLGLKFGSVPSINSLASLYQFQDKPWVFAHLLQLQKRLGREIFPLIEQTFFPNPRELVSF
ncbi:hypothetical protein DMENIID0001_053270 [Sergentomyia squamirostris]